MSPLIPADTEDTLPITHLTVNDQNGLPDKVKITQFDASKHKQSHTPIGTKWAKTGSSPAQGDLEQDLAEEEKAKDVFHAGVPTLGSASVPASASGAVAMSVSKPKSASGPASAIKISEPEVVDGWLSPPGKSSGRIENQSKMKAIYESGAASNKHNAQAQADNHGKAIGRRTRALSNPAEIIRSPMHWECWPDARIAASTRRASRKQQALGQLMSGLMVRWRTEECTPCSHMWMAIPRGASPVAAPLVVAARRLPLRRSAFMSVSVSSETPGIVWPAPRP